jgi:hypothetical protein
MSIRVAAYGAIIGLLVSVVLYPLMYIAALYPRAAVGDIVFPLATILWPTSRILMAAQSPGMTPFGITLLIVAVISNAAVYSLVALVSFFLLSRLSTLGK